jgi:hypothetical protein
MVTAQPALIITQTIHAHLEFSINIKKSERSKTDDQEEIKKLTNEIIEYEKTYKDYSNSSNYGMILKFL